MSLGKRVLELRKKDGYSMRELAKKCNLSHTYISDIEKDRTVPAVDTLRLLADALGTTMAYLLGETDAPEKSKLTPNDRITQIVADDPALAGEWKELQGREDLFLLFKEARDLSPKTIKQIIQIIKVIDDEES